jgi:hypothetical protein
MCSVQQLLALDDQLPISINVVLDWVSWGFHRGTASYEQELNGTNQFSRVAIIVPPHAAQQRRAG